MSIRRGKVKIPETCADCKYCAPVRVPMPYGHGMHGPFIPKGQSYRAYRCAFDHYSAVDAEGTRTSITPSRRPIDQGRTIDDRPFCPLLQGYYEADSTSSTAPLPPTDPERDPEEQYNAFPVVDGWRMVPAMFFVNNAALVQKKAQHERIKTVTDKGTVLSEMGPPRPTILHDDTADVAEADDPAPTPTDAPDPDESLTAPDGADTVP